MQQDGRSIVAQIKYVDKKLISTFCHEIKLERKKKSVRVLHGSMHFCCLEGT